MSMAPHSCRLLAEGTLTGELSVVVDAVVRRHPVDASGNKHSSSVAATCEGEAEAARYAA